MELNNIIITDITNWEVIGNWLEKEAKIERSLNFYSNAYRCYGEETAILIYDDALQYSPKSFYRSNYPFYNFTFYTQKEFEDTFINRKGKTVKEWFNDFPEPYKSKALVYAGKKGEKQFAETVSEALRGAFVFSMTPEGQNYWWDFHDSLQVNNTGNLNMEKTKTKPIEDWLKELPEPYRSKALYNRENYPLEDENLVKSLLSALYYGFEWDSTPEGYKYWFVVYDTIKLGGNLVSNIEPEESEKYDESIYDKWKSLLE